MLHNVHVYRVENMSTTACYVQHPIRIIDHIDNDHVIRFFTGADEHMRHSCNQDIQMSNLNVIALVILGYLYS